MPTPTFQNDMSRAFNSQWKDNRPWLVYDESKKAIFCSTCILAKAKSMYTKGGYVGGPSKHLKLHAIVEHGRSAAHVKATEQVAKMRPLQLAFNVAVSNQDANVSRAMHDIDEEPYKHWTTHAMRCAYFLAHHNLPPRLMPSLAHLVHDSIKQYIGELPFDSEPGVYGTYCTNVAAADFINVCSKSIMVTAVAAVKASSFYSLVIDESTDIAAKKNLVLMAR